MNKILRFSLLCLLTLICGITFAQTTVTFVAGTDKGADGGTATANTSLTKGGITITIGNGMLGRTDNYRCYKSQAMTISSTVGNITKIELTCTASDEAQYGPGCFTNPTVGTYTYSGTSGTWVGDAASVALTASTNQVRMTQVVVTYTSGAATSISAPTITGTTPFVGSTDVTITGATGSTIYYTLDGTDPTASSTLTGASPLTFTLSKSATVKAIAVSGKLTSTVASKDFTITTYTNATIADLNTYTADKQFINLTLTNAKVVYVDGYLVYVREGSKAAMFYNTGLTLALNSIISGNVKLDFTLYNSMPEVKKNSETNSDGLTITPATSTDLDPVSATISELLSHNHFADLIKLTNVTITKEDVTTGDKTTTTYYANSGSDKITLYGNIALYSSLAGDGKTHNIIAGYNGIFGGIEEIKPYDVDGVTMGLNTITTDKDNANSPIYNLAGQRVNKSYKGVIIQNGKKMINK